MLPLTDPVGPPIMPEGAVTAITADEEGEAGLSIARTAGDNAANPTEGPGLARNALQ